MIKWIIYLSAAALSFAAGAYVWKITASGRKTQNIDLLKPPPEERGANILLIDGSPVTWEDLEWEFRVHTVGIISDKGTTSLPNLTSSLSKELDPLKLRLLSSIIERKVLINFIGQDKTFPGNEGHRRADIGRGKASFQDEERLKIRTCEKGIISQYAAAKIFQDLKVGEGEIAEYFQEHRAEFHNTEKVVIRQILVDSEKEARKLLPSLTPGTFAEAAKVHSVAPEAPQGGRLGPFGKGQLPPFFDVAFSMKTGEISGIIKSSYGYHIIMLKENMPKIEQSLAAASKQIALLLLQKKREEEYQKWVEMALRKIAITTVKAG